jgi:hypothetical protein
MSATTKTLSKLGLCALVVWLSVALSSCAHNKPVKKLVEFTPTNPDLPALVVPVNKAKVSSSNATSSAKRAVVIVEKLVPNPGQEKLVAELKLELATTVENLRLTSEALDTALLRIPQLQKQVDDVRAWGDSQQVRAQAAEIEVANQKSRADIQEKRAERNGRERDVFVNLFAITLTILALLAAQPLIAGIAKSAGAYAPAAAIGLWIVAALAAYFASFWVIRGILRLLIVIL